MNRTRSGTGALGAILFRGLLSPIYCQVPTSNPTARPAARYAVLLNRAQPEYSEEARVAGLQGSVILCLDIGPTGLVEKVHAIQRLGLGLDEKAIEAVKQWQFRPGEADGRPMRVKQSVEVRFVLDQAPSWRVVRASYLVHRSPKEPLREVVQPVFSHYVRPDVAPCLAGGGATLVEVAIGKDGKPSGIQFIGEHNEAASHALSQVIRLWGFEPARVNGKPHESTVTFAMDCGVPGAAGVPADDKTAAPDAPEVSGNSPPVLLWKVDPDYTEEARRGKRQGTVQIYLAVDAAGHATRMLIVHPLGFGLDEQAMEAVTKWRFQAAMKDGKPAERSATIQVNFRLL